MAHPTDNNRNQDTGLSPESSLPAVTPVESPTGTQSAMRFEVSSDVRPASPPTLPISVNLFYNNPDLLMVLPTPIHWPEDREGDPFSGSRVTFQQWEGLILDNCDHYLRNGSHLRRAHMFITQTREDLDRPIEFVGVNLGVSRVPWSRAQTVRDRLDVTLYTLHGFLAALNIQHPTNTPHARIVKDFERIRLTQHLLSASQQEFLASDPGRFAFWTAQLTTLDPIYAAYREHVRQQPLSPISRQPELPEISVVEQASGSFRRSSEPEIGASTAPVQRERSASVPSLGEASVLMQSGRSSSHTREQKGKNRVTETIPEKEPLPHPAQSPGPLRAESHVPAASPPAQSIPPAHLTPPSSQSAPMSTPSSQQAQSTVDPGTLTIDQLIQLADEYSRDHDRTTRRQDRHMRSMPIINGRGELFQWEMDRAWYQYNKVYVDHFSAIAHDVLLHRQMGNASQKFGKTILTLEQQRVPNKKITSKTHDGLMLAASRFGTRPASQYTERGVQTGRSSSHSRVKTEHVGVQTTQAPRIGRGVQTRYSTIAPPQPTPPESLDVIDEEEEEFEEDDLPSDAETHFEGEEETFEDAYEEAPPEEDNIQTSRQARRQ
ncbi:hypothetical protein AAF712_014471 [Marasmius tenuissimus]|uniref:Uncharacterized protein n=1 Tax=Marasmius tenuissimus TaxID=585030 RepID=A0ABR2ZC34_9AGAR